MTHGYDEDLVYRSMDNLGWMLDFAVFGLGLELSAFYDLFLQTKYPKCLEVGAVFVVTGTTGFELVFDVLEDTGNAVERFQPSLYDGYSPEFWTGWALAYYQWSSSKSYQEINEKVPIEEILRMYSPFHEMDISHFCEEIDRRLA